ncbi:MAG: outer membrane beta-barrel protein [Bdellovibrionota bacterium]
MRGTTFLLLLSGLTLLLSWSAIAADTAGRTADGCTYKVINGQYLTSCASKRGAAAAPSPAAHDQIHTVSSAPVTDYGNVPMYRNASVAAPSLPPQQPHQGYSAPISSIERENTPADAEIDDHFEANRAHLKNKLLDQTYAGLQVGASNMKESNSGSGTGFGLQVGTNIDDTFGVELGFSYAKQDLGLGLASRGGTVDPSQDPGQQGPVMGQGSVSSGSDSTLSSNLFTGEVLAHLTDPVKRLRPYVGGGLGWRSATLTENASTSQFGQSLAGGSLHQNTLGALASAGTKLRLTKTLGLGFAFNYFLPVARQDSRLEQPAAAFNAQSPSTSKLSASDDLLTGSAQYQVLGGVQYSF